MEIGQSIYKIRNNAKLTQEQFAEIFEASHPMTYQGLGLHLYGGKGYGFTIRY